MAEPIRDDFFEIPVRQPQASMDHIPADLNALMETCNFLYNRIKSLEERLKRFEDTILLIRNK